MRPDDSTQAATQQQEATRQRQRQQTAPAQDNARAAATQTATREGFLAGQRCPACGTVNDPAATFCEHCGKALHDIVCPRCGTSLPPEADFCEHCNTYISNDRCPFCGAPMSANDEFCQECGSPRKGIVCPTCHSLGHFGFCERCGTPLTDRARIELDKAWQVEYAEQVRQLEQQLEELWRKKPVKSKQERSRWERNRELRRRVMELLREDGDATYADAPAEKPQQTFPNAEELSSQLEETRRQLQALLDQMEQQPLANPATARNIAMARRPHISRLAWRCNWKQALHPSPLACACPQKGGKWVVLSGHEEHELDN